jgi:rare lipoprotein A
MNPKSTIPQLLFVLLCILDTTCWAQKGNQFSEEGKASFYSNAFVGRKTANGEKFSQEKFIAAHKSLPFGTWVKVVNLQNKRSVIVRINDRGPFITGRVIDLSKSAAKQIGNLNEGIYRVRILIYKKDRDYINANHVFTPIDNHLPEILIK